MQIRYARPEGAVPGGGKFVSLSAKDVANENEIAPVAGSLPSQLSVIYAFKAYSCAIYTLVMFLTIRCTGLVPVLPSNCAN